MFVDGGDCLHVCLLMVHNHCCCECMYKYLV